MLSFLLALILAYKVKTQHPFGWTLCSHAFPAIPGNFPHRRSVSFSESFSDFYSVGWISDLPDLPRLLTRLPAP